MAKLRMAHESTHGARKPPGPTKFQHWEFPQSGSKAKDGEKERLNNSNNNAHCNATSGDARKAAWAKIIFALIRNNQNQNLSMWINPHNNDTHLL